MIVLSIQDGKEWASFRHCTSVRVPSQGTTRCNEFTALHGSLVGLRPVQTVFVYKFLTSQIHVLVFFNSICVVTLSGCIQILRKPPAGGEGDLAVLLGRE